MTDIKLQKIGNQTPILINGKHYFTLSQLQKLTKRSRNILRKLCVYGNSYRKMKHIKLESSYFIEVNELFNFPFTEKAGSRKVKKYYLTQDDIK